MVGPQRPLSKDLSDPEWEAYLKTHTIEGIVRGSSVILVDKLASLAPRLEEWIEKKYGGLGRALRERDAPPLDGEPWMSMQEAKKLTRLAVFEFILDWEATYHVDDPN